jgi:hypothetical protein
MSEYDQLLEQARRAGATVTRGSTNHFRIEKGGEIVWAASTPSDTRAVNNLRAELRRRGIIPRARNSTRCPALTRAEVLFMERFDGFNPLIVDAAERVPYRLEDRGLVRTSNRYRHGRLVGRSVWLTQLGVDTLAANR